MPASIDAFGPDWAVLASDFPVGSPAADFAALWDVFDRITAHLPEMARERLFLANARRIYRIAS